MRNVSVSFLDGQLLVLLLNGRVMVFQALDSCELSSLPVWDKAVFGWKGLNNAYSFSGCNSEVQSCKRDACGLFFSQMQVTHSL